MPKSKSKSKSNSDDDKVPGATAQEMLNAIRRIENAPLRTRDNKLHSFPVLPPKWEGRQETKISIVFIDHIRGGRRRGESSRFRGLSLEQCASGDGLAAPDEHVVLNARELNVVAMWPGYDTSKYRMTIPTLYFDPATGQKTVLTRRALLFWIGKHVGKMFEELKLVACLIPHWEISDTNIKREHVRIADIHKLEGDSEVWQIQMGLEALGGLPRVSRGEVLESATRAYNIMVESERLGRH